MTMPDTAMLQDHEGRISKLEDSQKRIEHNLDDMKSALDISEAKAQTRSDLMIKQNESLMAQNTRQATQLENVLSIVTNTKDRESSRVAELKKLQTDGRLKLLGYFLGGGGVMTVLFEIIQALLNK